MPAAPFLQPAPCETLVLQPSGPREAGHDSCGRFTRGHHGAQGNPAAQPTAVFRQALRAAISPEDITAIAGKLRELALGGNLSAIRLLLSYMVGRPGTGDGDDAIPPPGPLSVPKEATPATGATAPESVAPAVASSTGLQPTEVKPKWKGPPTPQPPSTTGDIGTPLPRPRSPTVDMTPTRSILPQARSASVGTRPP